MPQITAVLAVVSVLIHYGRHLGQTLEQRAVRRGFATIARFFGCVVLDTILAHVHRGMMRAVALQRMLEHRAKHGRDLQVLAKRATREPVAKVAAEPEEAANPEPPNMLPPGWAAAMHAADVRDGERLARRIARDEPLTLATLPSMAAMEAEVLRSSVGRSLAAICRDFGVSPSLCEGSFWNLLEDAVRWYRGNLTGVVLELKPREKRFEKEEWKHPGLELAEETRAGIRRVLGFFIGEDPVDPFEVVEAPMAGVAAVATGPP